MSGKFKMVVLLLVAAFLLAGCGDGEEKIEVKTDLAARIGDETISERELEERLETLPHSQKVKFGSRPGKANLVDEIINERIIYREALEKKLQHKKDVKQRLDYTRRMILMKAYYQYIAENVEVTEEEIQDYYQNNQLEFKTEPTIRAQHIFTKDSLKAAKWKNEIENSTDPEVINRLAKEESEDTLTSKDLGNLGYFNPHGYIRFIGKDKKFGNAVEWLGVGQVSDIIHHNRGYSIVKVKEKEPSIIKALPEVREEIEKKLKEEKFEAAVAEEIERLREKYNPKNYIREEILKNTRTPDELWELAREETSPKNKIIYYRAIANSYPDDKLAAQALFMIGFTYAEEIGDLSFARRAFQELLEKYPEEEVSESARWMMDNLGKKALKFDSVEEMEKEIEKE